MRNETKIGIFAAITLIVAIWGFQFIKGKNLLSTSNYFYVKYEQIELLAVSSPVLINGFQVGVVSSLDLDPVDMKTIVAVIDVRNGINIPKNTVAEIISTSMMGEKAIRLSFDKPCAGANCAESGDYLTGKTTGLMGSLLSPKDLDGYIKQMNVGINGIVDSLSSSVADPNATSGIGKSMKDVDIILENLKVTTSQMNRLMAASSGNLKGILQNMEAVTSSINASNAEIQKIMSNTAAFTGNLKNTDINGTLNKVNGTIDGSSAALEKMTATLTTADQAVGELNMLLAKVNDSDGTLNMLMKDRELYDNLNSSSKHMGLLLQDFRLHPKRYLRSWMVGKKEKPYVAPETDPGIGAIIQK